MRSLALLLLLAFSPPSLAAELRLVGEAREHRFVTVESDKAGQWLILGPNAAVVLESSTLAGTPVIRQPKINRADSRTVDGGKRCEFVGPPGFYAVTQWGVQGEADPSLLVVEIVAGGTPAPVVDVDPIVKPPPDTTLTPTAATWVYEKDHGGVHPAILSAFDKINRGEKKIVATPFEEDTTDASGQTPEQYKVALAAAKAATLPALVVTSGDKVLRVIKPKPPVTEEQILEAWNK